MRSISFYLVLIFAYSVTAQVEQSNYEYWLHFVNKSNNEDREQEWLFNYLQNLQDKPIDLNSWTEGKLRNCLLFTSLQSEEIISHRNKYGSFLSAYELRCLSTFDLGHISHLLPYISSKSSLKVKQKSQLKWSTHNKLKWPTSSRLYLGNLWKQQFKLQYQNALFSASFRTEKDEGERNFVPRDRPFDYTSFYFIFPKLLNRYKVIIGDYQLQFGQGLNLYTQRTISRNGPFASAKTIHMGMNPYRSFRENAALRGVGIQYEIKNGSIDVFFSKSKRDARIVSGKFSGFSSDGGLHRTISEYNKRNTLIDLQYGVHLVKQIATLKIGLISSFREFQYSPKLSGTIDQLFKNRNNKSSRYGLYSDYYFKKSNMYGEISFTNDLESPSYTIGLIINALRNLDMGFQLTKISKKHSTSQSEPFHIKSNFSGETNYTWKSVFEKSNWSLTSNLQVFQMNWLSSNLYTLDHGNRHSLELMVKNRNQGQLRCQWSQRLQLQNIENTYHGANSYCTYKIRIRYHQKLNNQLKLKTYSEINSRDNIHGHMIYNELQWVGYGNRINLNTRISVFHIPTSQNAIYFYESVAAGQNPWQTEWRSGSSFFLSIRYKLNHHLKLWLKYKIQAYPSKQEHYVNSVQNSSAELVNRNNTFAFQIQYRSD